MKKRILSLFIVLSVLCFSMSGMGVHAVPENSEILVNASEPTDIKAYCTATLEDDFTDNEILVVMNNSTSEINKTYTIEYFGVEGIVSIEDLTALPEDANIEELGINPETYQQILLLTLAEHSKQNVLDTIHQLELHPDIESAGANGSGEWCETIPNDTYYTTQWGLSTDHINAPAAWDIATGSSSVEVGIIDSGIASHADLIDNVNVGNDCENGGSNTTDDPTFHGTAVAGIIGAVGNNSTGITGVCWDVTLIPLQIADAAGQPSLSALLTALNYATVHNIPICNLSAGNFNQGNELETAIHNYPGLLVAAAGNETRNNDLTTHQPEALDCPNLLMVAATTNAETEALCADSNYGNKSVDLAAPGDQILTTSIETRTVGGQIITISTYKKWSGTSFAAPFVTGTAALIKSVCPELTTLEIKQIILDTVDYVEALDGKVASKGRLNAYAAVLAAQDYHRGELLSGDFDGDGDIDHVAFYGQVPNMKLAVWYTTDETPSNPHEKFFNLLNATIVCSSTAFGVKYMEDRLVTGDFDGDGKDEIAGFYNYGRLASGEYRTKMWVFRHHTNSSFSFSPVRTLDDFNAGKITDRVVAGDFDNDGKDEIGAFYDYGANSSGSYTTKLWIFQENSDGSYSDAVVMTSSDYAASKITGKVTAGDYNGDGKDEIAALYDYSSSTIKIWRFWYSNATSYAHAVAHTNTSVSASALTYRVVSGDFNGDGYDDISAIYDAGTIPTGEHIMQIWNFNGSSSGGYNASAVYGVIGSNANSFTDVVAEDFTGDGIDDFHALYSYNGEGYGLWRFAGTINNTFQHSVLWRTWAPLF